MSLQSSSEPVRRRRKKSPVERRLATDGEIVCNWIERYCFVPEGKDIGQPIKLLAWQRREILRIYDNPHGTRRAILSFPRKNGKSCLSAMLLLVHLCGPRYKPNSQLFSAAQSREQAAIIFNLAVKMIRMSPDLRSSVTIRETAKEIFCGELGTKYRSLSAEATTAYGLSPAFVIHDELGQVRGPRSILYEALETATGAQGAPLSVIISTQARTDADLLSVLIDDAMAGHDPRTLVSLYTADQALDPFAKETILLANPAFGEFLSETEVMAMAQDAERMPSREAEYRNLILNQRVEVVNPFVQPQMWKDCGGPVSSLDGCEEVYAGLDLSEVADLTSLVLIGRIGDVWHVLPKFWLPEEGLGRKAIGDRVPYDQWANEGLLLTNPGASVSYEYVAQYLKDEIFDRYSIQKIAFDRWNIKFFRPWLLRSGLSEQFITEKFVEFGQGMASMSPAIRDLEQLIRDRKLRHGNHPILTMNVASAIVVKDDAGNRKFSKRKSSGRIDGLVALTMAVGVAPLMATKFDPLCLIG